MSDAKIEKIKPVTNDLSITWHAMSSTDVLEQLNTGTEVGLTAEEVKARQEKYGLNELKEAPKTTFWEMLWAQINSFVIYLLLGAAIISALFGDVIEAAAIMAIVILNAIMGII